MSDPFELSRFVQAQKRDYAIALHELLNGKKKTHWMWYIFPQIDGLGKSDRAVRYAITSRREAKAYMHHSVLRDRLLQCASALLRVKGRTASEIMGFPDDMKLRSSMTLFAAVSPEGSVFHRVLDAYYNGEQDPKTLEILAEDRSQVGNT